MAVRRYVTKSALDCARRKKEANKLPFVVQISPMVILKFGSVGVSLNKHFRASKIREFKWVNSWDKMTTNEINQAFADQDWEVHV